MRTRRSCVTGYGRKVMATIMYLREQHFPNIYAGIVRCTSSLETRKLQRKNLCTLAPKFLLAMMPAATYTAGAAAHRQDRTQSRPHRILVCQSRAQRICPCLPSSMS